VIRLTNPATGHEVRTDEQSVAFWSAAGYVRQEPVKPAPKRRRAAKKSTTK
jgi:hypothetical protein